MARNFICLTIFGFLLPFHISAAILKGQINDIETGEPLIGATILLKNTRIATTSGLDGSFQIKNIPSDEYQVQVSYISYKTYITKVKIEKEDVILGISLEENNQQTLNEVIISIWMNF